MGAVTASPFRSLGSCLCLGAVPGLEAPAFGFNAQNWFCPPFRSRRPDIIRRPPIPCGAPRIQCRSGLGHGRRLAVHALRRAHRRRCSCQVAGSRCRQGSRWHPCLASTPDQGHMRVFQAVVGKLSRRDRVSSTIRRSSRNSGHAARSGGSVTVSSTRNRMNSGSAGCKLPGFLVD